MTKAELRSIYKQKRNTLDREEGLFKSKKAAEIFLKSELYKSAEVLMLYMPLKNEADTKRIVEKAFEDQKKVVFPVTDEETGEITPFFAKRDTRYEIGGFLVLEPKEAEEAKPDEIDLVLVPGIVFSRKGSRIGFGKGCYDKFLKKTNAKKIGYCYGFQICDLEFSDEKDVPMDFLISENGIIACENE